MATTKPGQVVIENATLIFKNFTGKETKYNRPGIRNFGVLLSDELANAMAEDDWNVKWLQPREEDEDATPQAWIPVEAAYDKGRPPHIVLITAGAGGKRNVLSEEQVEVIDGADIVNVDLILNPSRWDFNDRTGIKAYLKSMYVTIEEDPLQRKYSEFSTPAEDTRED